MQQLCADATQAVGQAAGQSSLEGAGLQVVLHLEGGEVEGLPCVLRKLVPVLVRPLLAHLAQQLQLHAGG